MRGVGEQSVRLVIPGVRHDKLEHQDALELFECLWGFRWELAPFLFLSSEFGDGGRDLCKVLDVCPEEIAEPKELSDFWDRNRRFRISDGLQFIRAVKPFKDYLTDIFSNHFQISSYVNHASDACNLLGHFKKTFQTSFQFFSLSNHINGKNSNHDLRTRRKLDRFGASSMA